MASHGGPAEARVDTVGGAGEAGMTDTGEARTAEADAADDAANEAAVDAAVAAAFDAADDAAIEAAAVDAADVVAPPDSARMKDLALLALIGATLLTSGIGARPLTRQMLSTSPSSVRQPCRKAAPRRGFRLSKATMPAWVSDVT